MNHGLRIRPASLADHSALEALQLRASLSNPGDRQAMLDHPDAACLPIEQIESGTVFVAVSEESILGFAAMYRRDDRDMQLDGLFVDPSHQKLGIGALLVEHCAAAAQTASALAIHVIGNPHAELFYLKCGFVRSGETETLFGPAFLFTRPFRHPAGEN